MTNRGSGLTDDDIIAIAKRQGFFSVTLRWRDDKLRARCFRLKKAKRLGGARRIERGMYIFTPVEPSRRTGCSSSSSRPA